MRRRLFNLAAVVSLVLCVAASAGAIRTQFVSETCCYQRVTERPTGRAALTRLYVTSHGGSLNIDRDTWVTNAAALRGLPPPQALTYSRATPTARRPTFGRFRFRWESGSDPEFARVAVPWWFLAAVSAALPAACLLHWRRERRRPMAGHCPTCGYDCRGPADGTLLERCPECGNSMLKSEG